MGTVEQVLIGALLWLNGNRWHCLCASLLEMDPLRIRCVGSYARNLTTEGSHESRQGYLPWLMSC